MKSSFVLFVILLLVCCQVLLVAQQDDPPVTIKNVKKMHGQFRHQPKGMDRKINIHDGLLKNSNSNSNHPQPISDLTEFKEFPYQQSNTFSIFSDFAPVVLSNGNLMMFWVLYDVVNNSNHDTLYCATSTDGGETWGGKKIIEHSPFATIWYMTALKTNSGRIIVFWASGYNDPIKMTYSDDNGDTWSSVNSLLNSPYISLVLSASQAADSTLYISYSREISGTYSYFDLVFRTSTDNGLTWSDEKNISNDQSYQYMCNIIPDTGDGLLAVYTKNSTIVKRVSSDGGNAWSTETTILDNPNSYEYNPRVVRMNNDSLCIVFIYNDWPDDDLYYSFSGDNGNTWSTPVQFTSYAGIDEGYPGICLYNNKPFVVFLSERWLPVYGVLQGWYGIIGITEDVNPPPAVIYSTLYKSYFAPDKEETILANIGDESGVQNAQVNISLNGGTEYSLQMFDDGQHNDYGIGDGIYGVPVGSFSLGDHLDYSFSVTDIDNNAINVQGFAIDIVQHGNPINPNKGFEETPVGVVSGSINGWYLGLTVPAEAKYEIVDDTVKEGNHALKITLTTLGVVPWDIQAVNAPFPVEQESQYKYLIWAKADKDNVFASFTIEDPTFNVWNQLYQVNLTTEWQEYSFDFFTPPDVTEGRATSHFGGSGNSTSLPIKFYIDDLRIVKLGSTVDVENDPAEIPSEFSLSQNYPNPFNPSTVISYQLAVGSHISFKVYDVLGTEIATLVNEEKPAGTYEVDFNASNLSSGIYFYKIEAGSFVQTKKMVLLR